MELTEQMIAELRSLVEQIAIAQPMPAKKFLFEMIFGLCASGSVHLSEGERQLPSECLRVFIALVCSRNPQDV